MIDEKIYVDASQPATLRYGTGSLDCYTLGEAGLEWTRLSEQNRERATIESGGRVYNANEIARLHVGPKPNAPG
jgi:hypothetical protein